MTTTIHEHSTVSREMEITIEETELQTAFDDAYRTMRPKLALPGFRPGKAPMSVVKRLHGEAIEREALETLAQKKFREALEEHNVQPLGQPVMTDLHRHKGEGAHFRIEYEIQPEFEIQDLSAIQIERHDHPVTQEDVDRTIERMRFRRATRAALDGPLDERSVVKLQFTETNPPEGREAGTTEEEIYLGDPDILPELKSALLGASIGDTLEISLPTRRSRSEDSGDVEKSEPAKVTVLEGEQTTLPEVDEAFIQELSSEKATTLEEFQTLVKTELEEAREKASKEDIEEHIVAKMLEMHPFEVPHSIVHAILDQMMEETQQENTRKGFPANYGIDEESFHDQNQLLAEARGRWMLLREKLVHDWNIEATDEDLEQLAAAEAEKYGLPKDNLLKYYRKYDTVKNRIVAEKLGTMLREKVTIV